MKKGVIELRGVAVHNLREIDLDIPRGKLVVVCGVSGSGKTSLALDTLYAEGQRRYLESFSAYVRQFLQRLEKPDAERIEGIPPAVAVSRQTAARTSRSTIGTATEIIDHLRLLYAKIGQISCLTCGQAVRRESPQTAAESILQLKDGLRFMVAFPCELPKENGGSHILEELQTQGFVRAISNGQTMDLGDVETFAGDLEIVVDRLATGSVTEQRLRDSLETAFANGKKTCSVYVAADGSRGDIEIDGRIWRKLSFSGELRCETCDIEYPDPEPRLFSFNSPLGACPTCEGFGNIIDIDMDLVVPDPSKSIRSGAIAPWNTPAYEHELEELLALAGDYDIPVDVPFADLTEDHLRLIREGVSEREFGGLSGFFAWLEKRKYKMHLRVFLSRWRSYYPCPDCQGARLKPESLATQIGGKNIAEVCQLKVTDAIEYFDSLELTQWEQTLGWMMLEQITARLGYLREVGLDYLTLDRTLRTLSGGEAQRVALTSALGSSLVNMLYVLDEPTVGLHPSDSDRLVETITSLRDRRNSVVVVEHEESMIRAADHVIEMGPGAGRSGGQVMFEGSPRELLESSDSVTGDYLMGRRGIMTPNRRETSHGRIKVKGASGNNLQNITVEFPLGVLCLVTGVSGSGKSTLVQDTLYPALCRRKRKEASRPHPHDDIYGDGQIDDVILIDQSPVGRSPRSNPVTYIKAFDQIRAVFADTIDARTHNYKASHFSFNVDGGRCEACKGDGYIEIDMQFLADVFMKCAECNGRRYRKEILEVTYRGKNIADVLEMSVREAFSFFRGQTKAQTRLKRLIDVGLDYLKLGQPANTLSSGESQRLKLAAYMSEAKRNRTLFILDEPTTGLHFSDVVQLMDCFDALLDVGHSLIVVEHNLQLMKSADYIIDLGPGAADAGGRIVATGTPEEIADNSESATGVYLRKALASDLRQQTA